MTILSLILHIIWILLKIILILLAVLLALILILLILPICYEGSGKGSSKEPKKAQIRARVNALLGLFRFRLKLEDGVLAIEAKILGIKLLRKRKEIFAAETTSSDTELERADEISESDSEPERADETSSSDTELEKADETSRTGSELKKTDDTGWAGSELKKTDDTGRAGSELKKTDDTGRTDCELKKTDDTGRADSELKKANETCQTGLEEKRPAEISATDLPNDQLDEAASLEAETLKTEGTGQVEEFFLDDDSETTGEKMSSGLKKSGKEKREKAEKAEKAEKTDDDPGEKTLGERVSDLISQIRDPENIAAFTLARRMLIKAIKHTLPRELKLKGKAGSGDPAVTGWILAFFYGTYSAYAEKGEFELQGDFEEKILSGRFYMKGRVHLIYYLGCLIRLLFNHKIRKLLKHVIFD